MIGTKVSRFCNKFVIEHALLTPVCKVTMAIFIMKGATL
jgi:hypothetical protein